MAVETLIPSGDGTRTGTWASTGASFYTEIDDYSGGGSADGATTNVRPPNKTNGATGYFDLTDTSAGFAPTGITQVQVRINFSRVIGTQSGGLDSLTLSVGMVQSDESTVLTDLIAVSGLPADESFTEQTVTLTNPNTAASKAVWDAGRLKIVQAYSAVDGADGISRLRITAAEVIATYTATTPVSADRDLVYNIIQAIPTDRDIVYSIRNAILADRDLVYSIRNSVLADRDIVYSIRHSVLADRDLVYTIIQAIPADRDLVYSIIQAISADRDIVYSIRNSVAADRDLVYSIRNSVLSDRDLVYSIAQAVLADRALVYDIGDDPLVAALTEWFRRRRLYQPDVFTLDD